jgi:flagellar secretion chaperone FliS
MYQNGIRSYRKTTVFTSNPGRLVIMCYEGAMDNLKIAKRKFAAGDFEGKCAALSKTRNIIDELLCSLDFEKGGMVARNLQAIYNYITRRIIYADVQQDMAAVDEVVGILGELLEAWKDVFAKAYNHFEPQAVAFESAYDRPYQGAMGL